MTRAYGIAGRTGSGESVLALATACNGFYSPDEGNMFIEFSKDHTPRHFRYAILPVKKTWNPINRGWEDIPDTERPMVPTSHSAPWHAGGVFAERAPLPASDQRLALLS